MNVLNFIDYFVLMIRSRDIYLCQAIKLWSLIYNKKKSIIKWHKINQYQTNAAAKIDLNLDYFFPKKSMEYLKKEYLNQK
ncbi:hypothetical protein BpHYR1_049811 [Brachionus plicatilis]|uniref:Uncharacterized protein n=1 Tax=Brachionus plicatilis TaxID=10195 RepID=A0A3M7RLE6_BRAPC|nr:hypothetical protein BpHYR1_049811 [Brachionus plicatilis]